MKPIHSFAAAAAVFSMLVFCAVRAFCDPAPSTNAVPNFAQVEPGVWRGGQPTEEGWKYLQSLGVSNVVKLNTLKEGTDQAAVNLGMKLHWCPIDDMQQKTNGPDAIAVSNAVLQIQPGTYVHCQHGKDRTGLVIGCYRLAEGTNKSAAWQEMTNHGYNPSFKGLTGFWENKSESAVGSKSSP